MTTVLQICTRSLRRLGVIDSMHSASSEDAQAALDAINELHNSWIGQGVDTLSSAFVLADTYQFFVPPTGEPINDLQLIATWDADANSPALVTATGTEGYVYRVATAGSTVLDDVTTWAENDYVVYDGREWLKGKSSAIHEGVVVALLAMRLADEFGVTPSAILMDDARRGWGRMLADYAKPPLAVFDTGLIDTQTARLTGIIE